MVPEAGLADKKRDRGIPGHDNLDFLQRRPEPLKTKDPNSPATTTSSCGGTDGEASCTCVSESSSVVF